MVEWQCTEKRHAFTTSCSRQNVKAFLSFLELLWQPRKTLLEPELMIKLLKWPVKAKTNQWMNLWFGSHFAYWKYETKGAEVPVCRGSLHTLLQKPVLMSSLPEFRAKYHDWINGWCFGTGVGFISCIYHSNLILNLTPKWLNTFNFTMTCCGDQGWGMAQKMQVVFQLMVCSRCSINSCEITWSSLKKTYDCMTVPPCYHGDTFFTSLTCFSEI